MDDYVQKRHEKPVELNQPRPFIVACPPMRSNVNLSRIARTAGCCGVATLVCCGAAKVVAKIARDCHETLKIENHRTLPPVLRRLRDEGYRLVGLEQTTGSQSLFTFAYPHKCVLVVGNERTGIEPDVLQMMDHVVEIPVYGMPYAHNAATATAMALYEYCRQYPKG
ncbi:MAG: TrmH family RNA methyltransferase [Thermoguttaceae bacterium]